MGYAARTLCAILKKEGDSYFMPSVASAGDKSVVHKSLIVVPLCGGFVFGVLSCFAIIFTTMQLAG